MNTKPGKRSDNWQWTDTFMQYNLSTLCFWGLDTITGFLQNVSPFVKGCVHKSDKYILCFEPDILLNVK